MRLMKRNQTAIYYCLYKGRNRHPDLNIVGRKQSADVIAVLTAVSL